MSDLNTQLKDYFEDIAPSIDIESLVDQRSLEAPPKARSRGWVVAAGVAVGTFVLIGGLAYLLGTPGGEVVGILPPVDDPGPGDPATSLPSAGFTDLPGF